VTLQITGIKVGLEDALDIQDALACEGVSVTTCVGGRIVANGYVCPHCTSCSPKDECRQNRQEAMANMIARIKEGKMILQAPMAFG
jgi:hypothetical protein